ncbi:MAG: hypothetical protein JXQ27_05210 [Acidobacteria bacterium]|nr:hypothetical protein [Acidobacteriota bacterium]
MGKLNREEMKELARTHKIALYSAKMVMKGNWTLDYALSLEKPVFNQGVRWMLQAKKRKWVMAFQTFDKGAIFGKILKVRKYNILAQVRGKLKYIEKIDIAYVCNSKFFKKLPEYFRHDPFVSDIKPKPTYKPSERREVDLAPIKERAPVRITLFTGEIVEGLVVWVTDYDFELKVDRYISLMIFKHAVWDAVEKEYHRFRQPAQKQFTPKPKKPFKKPPFERKGYSSKSNQSGEPMGPPRSRNRFGPVNGYGNS